MKCVHLAHDRPINICQFINHTKIATKLVDRLILTDYYQI